jgi:uncharacterized alpha-E superfamily protein
VPSRAADHLFWLGRYTERLEQLLRLIRCVLGSVSGEPSVENSRARVALAQLAANLRLAAQDQLANGDLAERMLHHLYAEDEPLAVRDLLKRIRLIASAVRDRFSGDTWRILGRLDADARARPGRLPIAGATALAHNLVLDLAAFNGMEMENMTRGRGWRFLDFGRRLERALSVLKLLRAAITVPARPSSLLEAILEIADSVMTYKRQYFAAPHLAGVLALLLRDDSNPRSFAFQLGVLAEHVHGLVVDAHAVSPQAEQARIAALIAKVRSADLNELTADAGGTNDALLQFLDDCSNQLATLSDEMTGRYFSHTTPRTS